MQRLSGIDEMFLALDTGPTTGHVAGISWLDQGKRSPVEWLAFIRQRLTDRLSTLPPLRWRLVNMPLGIAQRRWVDVGEIDLDHHLSAVSLAQPATDASWRAWLDDMMQHPLPRDVPMWQFYIVDGLPDGKLALVFKITHGIVDGSALWAVFDALSDDPATKLDQVPARKTSTAHAVGDGLLDIARRPVEMAKLTRDVADWSSDRVKANGAGSMAAAASRLLPGELGKPVAAVANRIKGDKEPKAQPLFPTLNPPKTPWSGQVTINQGLSYAKLDLTELRAIGKIAGSRGTINDGLMTVVSGALHNYMADHGGVPERPLVASVPISFRKGDEKEKWANQVWMIYLPIPTHLTDPKERVKFCHESSGQAKTDWSGIPGHLIRRASSLMPAAIMAPSMKVMSRMPAGVVPSIYNVAISNIKGPQKTAEFNGQPVTDYFAYGFLAPGSGLIFAGMSLEGKMWLCATVCKDLLPEYLDLPEMIRAETEALLEYAD